ncbi:MAG: hypothetical protein M1128_03180 [Candidatus Marsarchaeota archaeon]|nr:hypothetical protein [Candidatus Marsarchaeota archaeon]
MDGENLNMNYLYTFDGGGASYSGDINGSFTASWNSPPSSLIVMVYAASTVTTSSTPKPITITSTVELTNKNTNVNYSCTEYPNQEEKITKLYGGITEYSYNDVYIIVCPNIPTVNGDSYVGPTMHLYDAAGVVGTYAFNPNA